MEFLPLQTEAEYQAALKEISTLMVQDPDLGTHDGDRLNALVTLVQVYEAKHYAIAPSDQRHQGRSLWAQANPLDPVKTP